MGKTVSHPLVARYKVFSKTLEALTEPLALNVIASELKVYLLAVSIRALER